MHWFDHNLVLRDVYRLALMLEFGASRHSARFDDIAWLGGLHDEFFRNEAGHLLVSIAAAIRRIQDREWSAMSPQERKHHAMHPLSDKDSIGFYAKNPPKDSLNFGLRRACNCIMHGESIQWKDPAEGNLQAVWTAPYYDMVLSGASRADGKNFLMTGAFVFLVGAENDGSWEAVVHLPRFLKAATAKVKGLMP
ncbi:hypothetical protein [Methylobacillus methanolivorans]